MADVLVVDDDRGNRECLKHHLMALGHEIRLASSGRAALDTLEERDSDIILLDLMMPEGDGFTVLNALRTDAKLENISVIVISALDEDRTIARCLELGADGYLVKPYNATILNARIVRALDRQRREKAIGRQHLFMAKRLQILENQLAKIARASETSERNQEWFRTEKQRLLHLISHELRTPANSVLMASDLIADAVDPEERDECNRILKESHYRFRRALDYALHLSDVQLNGQADESEPCSILTALEHALAEAEGYASLRSVKLELLKSPAPRKTSSLLFHETLVAVFEYCSRHATSSSTVKASLLQDEEFTRITFSFRASTDSQQAVARQMRALKDDFFTDGESQLIDFDLALCMARTALKVSAGELHHRACPTGVFTLELELPHHVYVDR